MSRRNSFLAALLWMAFVWAGGLYGLAWGHEPGATPPAREAERREVRLPVDDFSLTDQNGRPFRLRALENKVVLLTFTYTTCPDVCPLITAAMRSVQANLSSRERGSVYFVTVTTDPEVDAPPVLAAYAKRYSVDLSNWSFVTGDPQALGPIWTNFGVKVRRIARGLIDHTPLTAVIDAKGSMRVAYHGAAPDPKRMLDDIRQLLVAP